MARQPSQGDLKYHFAGPLRPAILLLGLFKTFQLAADIDQDSRKFRPNGHHGPHHSFLRREHLVAQARGI